MDHFDKYIKQKYQQEVSPTFSDSAWDKFLAVQKEEDSRKSFFWWWLSAGGIFSILLIGAIATWSSGNIGKEISQSAKTQNSVMSENIDQSQESKTTKGITEKEKVITTESEINNHDDPEKASAKQKNLTTAKTFSSNQNESQEQSSVYKKNLDVPFSQNRTIHDNTVVGDSSKSFQNLLESKIPSINNEDEERADEKDFAFIESPLYKLTAPDRWDLTFTHPIIPSHKLSGKSRFYVSALAGPGIFSHRSTALERQYTTELAMGYQLGNGFSVEGSAGWQSMKFFTNIQSQSLGIRSVPLPRSSAFLEKIQNNSHFLEVGIGLRKKIWATKTIQASLSTSLIYSRELSQSLEYTFMDSENQQLLKTSANGLLDEFPLNYKINLLLGYRIKGQLHLVGGVSQVRSLQSSSTTWLDQWRFSMGFQKNF